ncbi:MAG: hypothetical protein JRI23_16415 [Deltaproteobacteria bacterium]|nr:hypothetical protein [Deltaproteobacteria bacterium]MBW2533359.1 hypothetical protein [Deltaproteobacteria bacterium]
MAFPSKPCISLEAPDVREWAHSDPRGFLAAHADGAVLVYGGDTGQQRSNATVLSWSDMDRFDWVGP